MELAPHTRANREFFAPGHGPSRAAWVDWISRGVVKGKVIDGRPYVDVDWFAANDCMQPLERTEKLSGLDLLT